MENGIGKCPKARRRRIRSFGRDRDGATVVEFALLAMPFTLLVFSVIESCISFAVGETMQNVVDDLARQVRTGQMFQDPGYPKPPADPAPWLKKRFCDRMEIWIVNNCINDTKLKIDLRSYTSIHEAAVATTTMKNNDLFLPNGFQFKPGSKQTVNTLRVYYEWPVITNLLDANMSNWKDRYILQFATATWQNEPFPDIAP